MTDDEYGVLDEGSIFRALADHGVEFVVVGGGAALAHRHDGYSPHRHE